jgi:cytochrome oxidase Cu insertion factor (SCO1/SenC/PrrC family)
MAESNNFPRTVWLGLSLAFGLLSLGYLVSLTEMARAHKTMLPILGNVEDFTLTNQDGKVTTLADLTNHVWIADIIFTRSYEQSNTCHAHDRSRLRFACDDEKIW